MDSAYGAEYRTLYERHWWWRAREALLLSVIEGLDLPIVGSRPAILDVGCADGVLLDRLTQYGSVTGVEPDAEVISRPDDRIHIGPFDHSFDPPGRFSLITMCDVLEHIADPVAALSKAVDLLEPGGFVVITVPSFMQLWTRHDELNHHYLRYTRETFADLAERSGLRVRRSEYFFGWTAIAKLAVRLKESFRPGPLVPPSLPPKLLNDALYGLSRIEQRVVNSSLAFGSSLLAVGDRA